MAPSKEERLLEELVQEVRELKELWKTCIEKGLITPEKEISKLESAEEKVSRVLKNLGIPASNSGYDYCKEAILMIIESEKKVKIGDIYNSIAQKHDISYNRAERNIRSAKIKASKIKTDFYEKIFVGKDRVVNSVFIFTIAEQLIAGII